MVSNIHWNISVYVAIILVNFTNWVFPPFSEGSTCSTPTDPCASQPCYPGVLCVASEESISSYTCGECPSGFTGDGIHCEGEDAISNFISFPWKWHFNYSFIHIVVLPSHMIASLSMLKHLTHGVLWSCLNWRRNLWRRCLYRSHQYVKLSIWSGVQLDNMNCPYSLSQSTTSTISSAIVSLTALLIKSYK